MASKPGRWSDDTDTPYCRELAWSDPSYAFPIKEWEHTEELETVRDEWIEKLKVLRCANHAEPGFPNHEGIALFADHLVKIQRNDEPESLKPGSWTIPEDPRMEGDARVAFMYFPTYAAISCLSLILQDYMSAVRDRSAIERALRRGLRFASYRKLAGHGYDAERECLQAVQLLAIGKVFTLTREEQPSLSPGFSEVLNEVEHNIENKMPNLTGFSSTDPDARTTALYLLRGGDSDESVICSPIRTFWKKQEEEWQKRRYARYCETVAEVAAKAVADRITPTVANEIAKRTDEIETILEEARPKYTVFQRRFHSRPVRMQETFAVRDDVIAAAKNADNGELASVEPGDELVGDVTPILARVIPDLITRRLRKHREAESPSIDSTRVEVRNGELHLDVVAGRLTDKNT